MKKLVIVGCGRLAEIVADAVVKGLLPDYNLIGVYSRTASKAAHIVNKMQQHGKPCIACATLEELLALKPDYLVESASPAAMRELALPALKTERLSLPCLSVLWQTRHSIGKWQKPPRQMAHESISHPELPVDSMF